MSVTYEHPAINLAEDIVYHSFTPQIGAEVVKQLIDTIRTMQEYMNHPHSVSYSNMADKMEQLNKIHPEIFQSS